jgi:hypothetical protein
MPQMKSSDDIGDRVIEKDSFGIQMEEVGVANRAGSKPHRVTGTGLKGPRHPPFFLVSKGVFTVSFSQFFLS